MRWEELFDDLEAQMQESLRRELDFEVADRTRRERAAIGLRDRLSAWQGDVVVTTYGGGVVKGTIADVGEDWMLVHEGGRRRERPSLVPLSAILTVTAGVTAGGGAPAASRESASATLRRFGLGYAFRALSRARAPVRLLDAAGQTLTGTIEMVGADVLDLAEHPGDLPPRPENITARRMVTFSAIAVVRPA